MSNQPPDLDLDSLEQQLKSLWQDLIKMDVAFSGGNRLPGLASHRLESLSNTINSIRSRIRSLEEQKKQWVSLVGVGHVINSSLDLEEVLCVVMDAIVRLTGAERGVLMLKGDEPGEESLLPRVARNWEKESIEESDLAISRSIIRQVFEQGHPILTTNAQQDPRFDGQHSIITHNLRAILCVPLKVKGETTGVIYVDNRVRTGVFTSAQMGILSAFANQAAVAIENARLYESVRQSLDEVSELKRLMEDVFTSMASGVITLDLDDRITLCNRASEKILGIHARQVVGRCLNDVLPAFARGLAEHLKPVRERQVQKVGVEISQPATGGRQLILSFHLSPLRDAFDQLQGVAIVFDDLTEKKRLEAQQRLFGRMVPQEIIDQLDPDQLELGGSRVEITALFADVEGFTSFSEKVQPEQLVLVLNRYLSVAIESVLAQAGTIDKFMGDAIMAWFNAPVRQPDHTLRAVRAALGIQEAVAKLHDQLPPEMRLRFRIGIHVGEAVLGLVGTEARVNYTAIGDVVNTAKRIQESAAAGHILMTIPAYQKVAGTVQVNPIEPLILKGKSQPVQVFELIGLR